MRLIVQTTRKLAGNIRIPGSKSHTIRAVLISSLAQGVSTIANPLRSDDTMAAVHACEALGARIDTGNSSLWTVSGFGMQPKQPDRPLNLANSGTSLRLLGGILSVFDIDVVLDGDDSLRRRPMQHLLDPLKSLGARAVSVNDNGNCPIRVQGRIKGGIVDVNGLSSQFVSSLLLAAPLADSDTRINVVNIHELPYIRMTLDWLDEQGIEYEKNEDLTHFRVQGGQRYRAFDKTIPGDWSSATFPIVAAAITDSDILLEGLDAEDSQGDKRVVDFLKKMGADIIFEDKGLRIRGKQLTGCDIDLNDTPDALPALSVLGCYAGGTTRLLNVAQARIKETDRITVMAGELAKMGASVREMEDGLVICSSELTGREVDGYNDHRIVMALALAGMIADGNTSVSASESVSVTFPGFVDTMKSVGAKLSLEE